MATQTAMSITVKMSKRAATTLRIMVSRRPEANKSRYKECNQKEYTLKHQRGQAALNQT